MIFKDREEAGKKLYEVLKNNFYLTLHVEEIVVVSLLRGGIIIGDVVAKNFKAVHLALVVTKIPAPYNPELAIGALCFDVVYLDNYIVGSLGLNKKNIADQISIAKEKFNQYLKKFELKEDLYKKLKQKVVVLVDDGIATGSTVKAALLYIKSKKAKKIFIAVPVAPSDFDPSGFDKVFIFYKDPLFSAVSQFYENFPQIEDEEVKKLLSN